MITCKFDHGNFAKLRHVVIDVLVLQGSKLLMVKRTAKLAEGGKWGITGGYLERDETITEAANREVLEETGYSVKGLTLMTIRDNPDRPGDDRQNVSFVFFCTAVEKVGEPDWESDEQRWFDLDNLPNQNMIAFDHYDNIELYKKFLAEKVIFPVV